MIEYVTTNLEFGVIISIINIIIMSSVIPHFSQYVETLDIVLESIETPIIVPVTVTTPVFLLMAWDTETFSIIIFSSFFVVLFSVVLSHMSFVSLRLFLFFCLLLLLVAVFLFLLLF